MNLLKVHKGDALWGTSNNAFDSPVNSDWDLILRERSFVGLEVRGKIIQLDDGLGHTHYDLQETTYECFLRADQSFLLSDFKQKLKLVHIFGEWIGGILLP